MKTIEKQLIVKKSRPGLGQGLFAAVPMVAGDFVAEYAGPRIPTSLADTLKNRYLFEVDDTWTIDGSSPNNVARHINHSCVPNCEAKLQNGSVFVYAARDIERGEELTMDYGSEYFDEFIRPQGCKCSRCGRPTTRAQRVVN
ncbi:MAG: SET domain-containing protein-lysine N-methyltransferase [bacterium]|nr:SET domain-containing protein-lysine N-methyltransferase [bacterium]